MNESDKIYKNIGEVVKILELRSKKGNKNPTHTLRYWEKEFKQLNPKILNGKRRYYDEKNINLLKKIKYLLKDQGMTINGVKKILNNKEPLKLDETSNHSIKASDLKNKLMAKKTHIKVRLVPETKPDSPFFYYVKKPAGGEKAKVKLKAKKYNPATRKHEVFVEKKLPPHSK